MNTYVEQTHGPDPTGLAWLAKLPVFDLSWDRETQNAWLEALSSIREAFPSRHRFDVPLSPGYHVIISWPHSIRADDLAFVIQALTLMEKHFRTSEEGKQT